MDEPPSAERAFADPKQNEQNRLPNWSTRPLLASEMPAGRKRKKQTRRETGWNAGWGKGSASGVAICKSSPCVSRRPGGQSPQSNTYFEELPQSVNHISSFPHGFLAVPT